MDSRSGGRDRRGPAGMPAVRVRTRRHNSSDRPRGHRVLGCSTLSELSILGGLLHSRAADSESHWPGHTVTRAQSRGSDKPKLLCAPRGTCQCAPDMRPGLRRGPGRGGLPVLLVVRLRLPSSQSGSGLQRTFHWPPVVDPQRAVIAGSRWEPAGGSSPGAASAFPSQVVF
jgi:hypothetical protein